MSRNEFNIDNYLGLLPQSCESLLDVRDGIDRLDNYIIQLLGRRMSYVLAASGFKKNEVDIQAPDRVARMLPERRRWAEQAGLDGNYVESLFEGIIHWYINEQVVYWRKQREGTEGA